MKKPKTASRPRQAGGGSGAPVAPKPFAPVPVAVQIRQHKAAVKAAAARKKHPAHKKTAAKKTVTKPRKLAGPGENCVIDACYAVTGHWLGLDGEDGLFIPGALELLQALGLIAGFDPADLDDDSPGLILGVDLPGPHAVLTTPNGWWSWGEPYDPSAWPDAVIEEAWAVTWS